MNDPEPTEHELYAWTDREGVMWECDAYDHGPFCRQCRRVDGADVKTIEHELAERIEQFRKALMTEHAHDWDMDTISEAAHICARSLVAQ